jgi:hypothetical protein
MAERKFTRLIAKSRAEDLMIKPPLKKSNLIGDRSLTSHNINSESLNIPRILRQKKRLV